MATSSLIICFFLISTAFVLASSAPFISDHIFDSHASTGRSLLQTKQGCDVKFEFMNYTIITSQCKGPHYPPKLCCEAFKQFACPYAEALNDMKSECAETMFSYINLYGKYPPGLFVSECKEDKAGLDCANFTNLATTGKTSANGSSDYSIFAHSLSPFLVVAASLMMLYHMI
ncbi:GPI-anchored protein llg1 [Ranunculus cassubicifolius]